MYQPLNYTAMTLCYVYKRLVCMLDVVGRKHVARLAMITRTATVTTATTTVATTALTLARRSHTTQGQLSTSTLLLKIVNLMDCWTKRHERFVADNGRKVRVKLAIYSRHCTCWSLVSDLVTYNAAYLIGN